jgi:hypothetical protein
VVKTRGRTSAASLALPPPGIEAVARPDAPYDLTDEQAAEWWALVNRMPADWFPRETHGLLAQYCRHVVAARRIAEMIGSLETELRKEIEGGADRLTVTLGAAKALDRLLKMQEREGRALSSLATRMRLTQQTTYDKSKKKPTDGATGKPWEG